MEIFLSTYFRETILDLLPKPESCMAYYRELVKYLENPKLPLIIRKFGKHSSRGKHYVSPQRSFTVSDNEAALWIYHRCLDGLPAEQVINANLLNSDMPIAFAFKKGEKKEAKFKKVGRKDKKFSKNGWKHCHLLQCSPQRGDFNTLSLEKRFLRLMTPFNHFPFPSPRKWGFLVFPR